MPLPAPMPQIDTPEVIRAPGPRVACGGGGALGHPRVFLSFAPNGRVVCPYCSRVYEQAPAEGHGHH
jgi:uncharacterized Zn-finger protein